MGHTVKIMPPQYVKAYVKRGKNDTNDAAAICEAMSRPSMRFVAVKTAEQQADLMLVATRNLLLKQRTQLANAIRGHAAEFGVVGAQGIGQVSKVLARFAADERVPSVAKETLAVLADQYDDVDRRLAEVTNRIEAWHRTNSTSERLATIPGVGSITAAMTTMKVTDPTQFKSGRHFAASLGLTPKDHSTAGRQRLGSITKQGDEALRSAFVVGAMSIIANARRARTRQAHPWLMRLLERKTPKEAAVAMANKNARIAWKLMVSGERYRGINPQNEKASAKLGVEGLAA